jgi:uncharacterized protein (DUF2336 family)
MPDLDDEIAVTRWAFALSPAERGRLLLAVANVLAAEDLRARPRARALLDPLLPALAEEAPAEMSGELARRLLDAAWAPDALMLDLAFAPDADLAPVVARADGLSDPVVLRLAAEGGPEARLVLAKRATLPGPALDALMEAARREPALRAPLVRHAQLSPEQAEQLQAFVGPELRGELASRFELAPGSAAAPDGETEARLLEKLDRAGRLTPSYALAALRRGRLGLFQQAVARLGGVEPGAVQQAVANDRATGLALACAASGIDRAVFPVVLQEVAGLTGRSGFSRPGGAEVAAAFRRPPAEAARVLRTRARRSAARWKAGPTA